ncbi:hypothetical protein TNCT_209051 [Trichonephila clavata]|uniref:Uncharacterized protein n=1 Tax=Trichonephila clavata TaxID=2740835 RepID=A0A8X6GMT8_TRICU|nr:hypothetical protein TNCT_209051 [Trichonephila clavata]
MDKNMDMQTTSRATSPEPSSRCLKLQDLTASIQRFTFFVQDSEYTLNSLQKFGTYDEVDPYVKQLLTSLCKYSALQQQAIGEYTSLLPCDTPGCPTHVTHNTPSKESVEYEIEIEQLELEKITSTKRKENDDGFITPLLGS